MIAVRFCILYVDACKLRVCGCNMVFMMRDYRCYSSPAMSGDLYVFVQVHVSMFVCVSVCVSNNRHWIAVISMQLAMSSFSRLAGNCGSFLSGIKCRFNLRECSVRFISEWTPRYLSRLHLF